MMTNVNPVLAAFLNSRPSRMDWADCVTFTLTTGTVYRWTSWDVPVAILNPTPAEPGLYTWQPGPPDFTRATTSVEIGLKTAEHQIFLQASGAATLGGVSILAMIQNGGFNLAQYSLDRAIAAPGGPWLGTIHRFFGEVSDIQQAGRTGANLTVKAMTHRFDTDWPRNTMQPGCLNTLFDTGCGLSKALWLAGGIVAAGSTANKVLSSLANADDYFDLGILTFTSGVLTGVSYQVRKFAGGMFTFVSPMMAVPSAGDSFNVSPGCDRQKATCSAKYGNLGNFRGLPFLPDPTVGY